MNKIIYIATVRKLSLWTSANQTNSGPWFTAEKGLEIKKLVTWIYVCSKFLLQGGNEPDEAY